MSCARDRASASQIELAMPIQTLMGHALANPSDISRLSFLQYSLQLNSRRHHAFPSTDASSASSDVPAAAATVHYILDTALRLRLRGDAIWTFLRSALVSREGAGIESGDRGSMVRGLREWAAECEGGDEGEDVKGDVHARDLAELRAVVEGSLRWIARWEGLGVDVDVEDVEGRMVK